MTRDLFHAVAVRYRNELAWLRFRIQAVLLARQDRRHLKKLATR